MKLIHGLAFLLLGICLILTVYNYNLSYQVHIRDRIITELLFKEIK